MSEAAARKGEGGRGIAGATVAMAIVMAILISLGVWQLNRMAWKENLIATVTARLAQSPIDLPPREQWPRLVQADAEYSRVKFRAEFLPGQEAFAYTAGSPLRPDVTGQGYWVFAPARVAGGAVVLINRGFMPTDRKDAATRPQGAPAGPVDVVGYMRWPEGRGLFTPNDDAAGNVFYARDQAAMAAARNWTLDAPFYVDQELPVPPGGLPKPGTIDLKLPNNHWGYALTWFGLAASLACVYLAWLFGRLRRR